MDYSKMSKAEILKKYGSFIKDNFGKDELDYVKGENTASVRSYIISLDPEPKKKLDKGGLLSKKYMNPVKVVDNLKLKK
tara:strand:- start:322 stop:558 length:237 start_codon:yes stop_codon:yes gene_type:complete